MAGNQGNQGCGEFILDCVKCAAAPANAEVKTDIKSSPTTVAAAVSASAAAFATAAKAAAFATAAKAIASAAAAASVTNPASAAALDATAATAGAAAIASAAATAAAAAADGVPALVATFANAAAADPGNQNLNNLSKVAEDAVSAALLYTNTCAAAADAAATDAAAALAHSNLSAPPYLEPGSGYISCNGIVKCICGCCYFGLCNIVVYEDGIRRKADLWKERWKVKSLNVFGLKNCKLF